MSRRLDREYLIATFVTAWNNIDRKAKRDLLLADPDLYSACSWLAASETVKRESRRK